MKLQSSRRFSWPIFILEFNGKETLLLKLMPVYIHFHMVATVCGDITLSLLLSQIIAIFQHSLMIFLSFHKYNLIPYQFPKDIITMPTSSSSSKSAVSTDTSLHREYSIFVVFLFTSIMEDTLMAYLFPKVDSFLWVEMQNRWIPNILPHKTVIYLIFHDHFFFMLMVVFSLDIIYLMLCILHQTYFCHYFTS